MSNDKTPPPSEAAQQLTNAANDLFDYAVGREELHHIMALLPEEAPVEHSKVEYELQILKIITVGWSITYFLEAFPHKEPLAILYWEAVRGFSRQLSETAELLIEGDVNYFDVLRNRLDFYVEALARRSDAAEPATAAAGDPAAAIGPAFADTCGAADDVFTIMSGARMFVATTGRVKQMLEGAVQS
ncbi:MAG: hypothetical protein P8010_04360 [Desulfosarcinaceae bacterium]|jgi:hypothetical protein